MGHEIPGILVPETIKFYNILSKEKFKSILKFCLHKDNEHDKRLVEQLLAGALAAVELDCIADINDEALDAELTGQHYLEYVEIANEVIRTSRTEREDVRAFVDRISKLCYAKSSQGTFLY